MNGLDWVIAALLAISTLSGFMRGLVRTLFGLLGWILAAIVAFRFADAVGSTVLEGIHNTVLRTALAMMVLFLVVGLAVGAAGAVCARMIRAVGLGMGDRLLGAVFGAVRGCAFVMLATVAAGFTTFPHSLIWRNSFFGPQLEAWALEIRPFLPDSVAALIHFGTEI
jgi:membrane protein required for colicin V production